MSERVQALVANLVGTCQSIFDEQEDWTAGELAEFDSEIFCCRCCGWWCAMEEAAEEDTGDDGNGIICQSCYDEANPSEED